MKRREFMSGFGVVATAACIPDTLAGRFLPDSALAVAVGTKLTPPAKGKIPVAFAISEGVTVIDFAGPWEVFQDVHVTGRGSSMDEQMPFQLYTVSEKTEPITGSGGLKLVPDYRFESAPQPKVVVVGAQRGSKALHAWLNKMSTSTDLIMSVCTGAPVCWQASRRLRITTSSNSSRKRFPTST